jgi:hypothetical protein
MGKNNKLLSIVSIVIIFISMYVFVLQNKEDQQVVNKKPIVIKPTQEQYFTNLMAFGKLYGYIRYFHPSDESAELDWNRFAIYGVDQVKNATNEEELKVILEKLFLPIAPTMKIYDASEKPKPYKNNAKEGKFIAWQHYGLGNGRESLYRSERFSATLTKGTYKVEGLFESFPKKNEVIKENISESLVCSIPLALPTGIHENKSGTLGSTEKSLSNYQNIKENLLNMDPNMTSENENTRFAGIIVTWNVLNHFYPHLHEINSDWKNQLEVSLKDTADDQSREEYQRSLMRLIEKTSDGAASSFARYLYSDTRFPFTMDIIENKVVVTEVTTDIEPKSPLKIGDIILQVNEKNSIERIEEVSKELSGSPHLKSIIAMDSFHYLEKATFKIDRDDQIIDLVVNSKDHLSFGHLEQEEPFIELEEGIYYLKYGADKVFKENIDVFSQAKRIIIDLRAPYYPIALMEEVISHLTKNPIKGPIKKIMQTIYPDQKSATYAESSDEVLPKEPFIHGKVVFLTNSGTRDQLEYLLTYIKNHQLAQIVGQRTAGIVGNTQTYSIPGNLTGTFTGMEVLNAKGNPINGVGIEPDLTVTRTLKGVSKGEDEFITKALEWIKNNK